MTIDMVAWIEQRIAVEDARIAEHMAHSDDFFRRYLALDPLSDLRSYWLSMSMRIQSHAGEAHARKEQYSRILQHMKGRMQ